MSVPGIMPAMFPTTWPKPAQTSARTGTYLHAGMTRGYVSVSPVRDANPPRYHLEFTALGITHSGGDFPTLSDAMHEAEQLCPQIHWDR